MLTLLALYPSFFAACHLQSPFNYNVTEDIKLINVLRLEGEAVNLVNI